MAKAKRRTRETETTREGRDFVRRYTQARSTRAKLKAIGDFAAAVAMGTPMPPPSPGKRWVRPIASTLALSAQIEAEQALDAMDDDDAETAVACAMRATEHAMALHRHLQPPPGMIVWRHLHIAAPAGREAEWLLALDRADAVKWRRIGDHSKTAETNARQAAKRLNDRLAANPAMPWRIAKRGELLRVLPRKAGSQ